MRPNCCLLVYVDMMKWKYFLLHFFLSCRFWYVCLVQIQTTLIIWITGHRCITLQNAIIIKSLSKFWVFVSDHKQEYSILLINILLLTLINIMLSNVKKKKQIMTCFIFPKCTSVFSFELRYRPNKRFWRHRFFIFYLK